MKKYAILLIALAIASLLVSCGDKDPDDCKHKFGDWITLSESTCSTPGKQVKICSKCEYTEELELSLLPHTPAIREAVEAGCVTGGLSAGIYCSVCNAEIEKQKPTAAKGHNFVNGKCSCGAEAGKPQIIVSSVSARAGDTVEIAVAINNNPDIASLLLEIEFNNGALTLEEITYSDKIGGCTMLPEENESPVKLYWISSAGNTAGDFTLATLRFKVNTNASDGYYAVKLTYDEENVFNFDEENVNFEVVNGEILVI